MKRKRFYQPEFKPEFKELALRFTRYAWGKLVYVNCLSTTEISGFCISNPKDLLLVEDIAFLQQVDTGASTLLDDEAVADFFDDQVDKGRKPQEFARIWLHTHPNRHAKPQAVIVPSPSGIDEDTIERVFGPCDWAVMLIYSGGSTGYARLALKKPVEGQIILPVKMLRKGKNPTKRDYARWQQEFKANITEEKLTGVGVVSASDFDDSFNLLGLLDTDIDVDEFIQFLNRSGQNAYDFCQIDVSLRQWWMNEFRKDRETRPQSIIRNPHW